MNLRIRRKPAHKHLHNALVANRRLSKLKEVNNKQSPHFPQISQPRPSWTSTTPSFSFKRSILTLLLFGGMRGEVNFYPPGRLLALYPPLPLDQLASRALEAEPRTRPEEEDALTMDLPAAMPRITPIIP